MERSTKFLLDSYITNTLALIKRKLWLHCRLDARIYNTGARKPLFKVHLHLAAPVVNVPLVQFNLSTSMKQSYSNSTVRSWTRS